MCSTEEKITIKDNEGWKERLKDEMRWMYDSKSSSEEIFNLNVKSRKDILKLNSKSREDDFKLISKSREDDLKLNSESREDNLNLNSKSREDNLKMDSESHVDNFNLNSESYEDRLPYSMLQTEIDVIRNSLDNLKQKLLSEQHILTRDFEDRIRHVYHVIEDINQLRRQVNSIGTRFEPESKFNAWAPTVQVPTEIINRLSLHAESRTFSSKLKSKSVDFIDLKESNQGKSSQSDFKKFQSKTAFSRRNLWLSSSKPDVSVSNRFPGSMPAFEGSLKDNTRTVAERSSSARNRTHSNSRRPNRPKSLSALDDVDANKGQGRKYGKVSHDWRSKVIPFMSESWTVPGYDRRDLEDLRDRQQRFEAIRHEVVQIQNEYRRQHGCSDFSVTDDLARDAQKWADKLADRGLAQFSDHTDRGENVIVVDSGDTLSARQIVDTWYKEGRCYNYRQPRWQKGTSSFTQMVWKESLYVGVGISKFSTSDKYVVVVQYQPPGNVNTKTSFQRNVPPPIN